MKRPTFWKSSTKLSIEHTTSSRSTFIYHLLDILDHGNWLNSCTWSLLLTSNQQLLPLLSLTFYVVLIFLCQGKTHTDNKEKITNRKQPNFHCATLNELLYSAPTNLSQISFFHYPCSTYQRCIADGKDIPYDYKYLQMSTINFLVIQV